MRGKLQQSRRHQSRRLMPVSERGEGEGLSRFHTRREGGRAGQGKGTMQAPTAPQPLTPYASTHPRARTWGVNLVAEAKALLTVGSARWSVRLVTGPLPVTMACARRVRGGAACQQQLEAATSGLGVSGLWHSSTAATRPTQSREQLIQCWPPTTGKRQEEQQALLLWCSCCCEQEGLASVPALQRGTQRAPLLPPPHHPHHPHRAPAQRTQSWQTWRGGRS